MKSSDTVRGSWDLFVSPSHLDERLDGFPVPVGAVMSDQTDAAGRQIDSITSRCLTAAETIAQADRPLVLAGDCLSSLATVAALQRRDRDVSVIWLDAHGDFNTPAISTSGYLAGMSLAMLTGRAFEPRRRHHRQSRGSGPAMGRWRRAVVLHRRGLLDGDRRCRPAGCGVHRVPVAFPPHRRSVDPGRGVTTRRGDRSRAAVDRRSHCQLELTSPASARARSRSRAEVPAQPVQAPPHAERPSHTVRLVRSDRLRVDGHRRTCRATK